MKACKVVLTGNGCAWLNAAGVKNAREILQVQGLDELKGLVQEKGAADPEVVDAV